MFRKGAVLTAVIALSLLISVPAQAGLVDCDVSFDDDPNLVKHGYDVYAAEDRIAIHEGDVDSTGPDPSLTCDGTISGGFAITLHIDEDAVNTTGADLTGWKLELENTGTATFTDSGATPSSSHFLSYTIIDDYTMQFDAPNAVPNGETLNLDFYISIPWDGSGSFNFTLTQTPIPEPATLGMLASGAMLVFFRKRRR